MIYSAEELHTRLAQVDTGVCEYSLDKCHELMPLIRRIQQLKEEYDAIVLAHTYVAPEIIYGVADHVGDSYALSKIAKDSRAETIVFCAVRFMAETAKILSPEKRVIQTSLGGGCTLADSISGQEVRSLRKKYPEHTFICYINTTAEVKASCHLCVTSSNVYDIVAGLENDKIYFLPDRLMAENLRQEMQVRGIQKEILNSDGMCYVHEGYAPEMVDYIKLKHANAKVAVHPECAPEVVARADYVGSTAGIYSYVRETPAAAFLVVSECGLSSRIQAELTDKKIVGSCTFCRYMKENALESVIKAMEDQTGKYEIHLQDDIMVDAKRCINRMFAEAEK